MKSRQLPVQSGDPATVPSLLRTPRYLWWLLADTSSAFGGALHNFAVPLLALYITGSPIQAGVIAAIGQVGRLLSVLPGGVLADRHDRRRLMLIGAVSGLGIALALAAFQLTGLLGFWLLTTLNLLMNIRSGLFGSTSNAALKNVVDESRLGSAMAANQGRDAAVALSGGPAGGGLMALGLAFPFIATAASHAVGLVSVLRIRGKLLPDPVDAADDGAAPASGAVAGYTREAWEGFAWLLRRPELRGVMVISTIVNLGVNAAMTSVVFGLQQRGESSAAIGWVSAAMGIGMLVGSLAAPAMVRRVPTGRLGALGLVAVAGGVSILPFVHSVPAIMAVLAGSILAAPSINASLLGYFMVAVPSRLLGRATSALDLLAMGAIPLAPLVAGFGYAAWGWAGVLLLCAGICALAAMLAVLNRGLRTLPESARWPEHAQAMAARAADRFVNRSANAAMESK